MEFIVKFVSPKYSYLYYFDERTWWFFHFQKLYQLPNRNCHRKSKNSYYETSNYMSCKVDKSIHNNFNNTFCNKFKNYAIDKNPISTKHKIGFLLFKNISTR